MCCTSRSYRWQRNSSGTINGAGCSRCCEPFSIYRTALRVHDVVNPDRWEITTLFETINLEIQMQERREEHRSEKGIHPSFTLCDDLNSIQCVLKEPKYQFDLPSIRIQDNHLKCGDVGSIGDQAIGCGSNRAFN